METKRFEKKAYSTPKLIVYGDVDVLTQGQSTGSQLDQTFPQGTFRDDLTFSDYNP